MPNTAKSEFTVRKTGDYYGVYFRGSLVEAGLFVDRKTAIKQMHWAEHERRQMLLQRTKGAS